MAPGLSIAVRAGEVSHDDCVECSGEVKQCKKNTAYGKDLLKKSVGCPLTWVWSSTDRSREAVVTGSNSAEVTLHPHWSNGTAGIRGSQPLVGPSNYWEIHVGRKVFGTSLMFGVSTKHARLHADQFTNLLGEDCHGWGLSHRGHVYHAGVSRQYCAPFQEYTKVVVGVLLDRQSGEISFFKDGRNLGVAFNGMNEVEDDLYPTVCSTAAKTNMTLGRRERSFLDLGDRCRHVVMTSIKQGSPDVKGKELEKQVDELPLPSKMKNYILEVFA